MVSYSELREKFIKIKNIEANLKFGSTFFPVKSQLSQDRINTQTGQSHTLRPRK